MPDTKHSTLEAMECWHSRLFPSIMEIFMLEGTSELGVKGGGNKGRELSHLKKCLLCSIYFGGRLFGKGNVFYGEPWFKAWSRWGNIPSFSGQHFMWTISMNALTLLLGVWACYSLCLEYPSLPPIPAPGYSSSLVGSLHRSPSLKEALPPLYPQSPYCNGLWIYCLWKFP